MRRKDIRTALYKPDPSWVAPSRCENRNPLRGPLFRLGWSGYLSNQAGERRRTGSVLVLTLIVVALLTLGAASFFERMFAEHRATRASGRQLQARHLAESGVSYLQSILMQEPIVIQDSGGLYANPGLFQGVMVVDDPLAAFRGRFTAISPDITTEGYFGGMRYGLENESSRLNLNTVLLADNSSENGARNLLMRLPGMTESIADAILDWIDSDDETRLLGAERDYYSSLAVPYAPRNGPLGSIEELLMVRDVTPALLFGADLNRNTSVDGVEQSLTVIDNVDNAAGYLNRGWAAFLTLDSAETNLRPDGKPKIDVNKDDLEELHKELVDVIGTDMANFVIAYRQGGPYEGDAAGQPASGIKLDFTQPGRQKLSTILDLIGVRTRIASQGSQGGEDGQNTGPQNNPSNGNQESGGGRGRDGNDSSRIVVEAAFSDDSGSMQSYLTKLMDNVAVNNEPTIPGRLNINQAPRQLLAGVPGMTPTEVDQIIANRDVTLGQIRPEQVHETWLLTDGIVELEKMKRLMALVTTGGNVYRAQVVGFYDAEGPADRLEVVIDATQTPPVVRRRWQLRELGPGYSLEVLGAALQDGP
jgi:type II secretory pathway component PulK